MYEIINMEKKSNLNVTILDISIPHIAPQKAKKYSEIKRNLRIKTEFKNCGGFEITINREVEQGNLLSPLLFNWVIDFLIIKLNEDQVGFRINDERLFVLALADDLVLVRENTARLQKLRNMTISYVDEAELNLNLNVVYLELGNFKTWKTE